MGKKKGPAARAAISLAPSGDASQDRPISDEPMKVHHDGSTCVTYVGSNGSEYIIDIVLMEQLNVQTGTRRRVFRHEEPGKFCWNRWQFEAATAGCRHYTPPKSVAIALEECYQAFQKKHGDGSMAHKWRHTIAELQEAALWNFMEGLEKWYCENNSEEPMEDPGDDSAERMAALAKAVSNDESLQQVLAERILQAPWPDKQLTRAVRCLLHIGWQPIPTNCRSVALSSGSLGLLRLLLETGVDVCGLVLFEHGQKKGKRSQADGSWVQRSKNALRALMARGAVLGDDAPRSKLLKKLEEDGDILWLNRALDGLGRAHPELPDCIFNRLRGFF